MSSLVFVKKSNVLILADNIEPLLKVILKNHTKAVGEAYRINNFNKLSNHIKIIDVIKNTWGFLFGTDKKGHISGLEYIWEKPIGDEFEFMKTIAPFVEKHSYVVMFSDKGDTWRYYFNGSGCELQLPEIRWLTLEKGRKSGKNEN